MAVRPKGEARRPASIPGSFQPQIHVYDLQIEEPVAEEEQNT
jgi:hypothetical protein